MTVFVLWFILAVLWVSLQCVIVVFPDHAHLLLHVNCEAENDSFCISVQQKFRPCPDPESFVRGGPTLKKFF